MLRVVPRLLVKMGSIAVAGSVPLRRSGRAQASRSMMTTRAALIQESEDSEMFTATIEESRVEVRAEELQPGRRRKRGVGTAGIAAVGSAQDNAEGTIAKKRRKASKQTAQKEEQQDAILQLNEAETTTKLKKRKGAPKTAPEETAELVDRAEEPLEPVKKRKPRKKKAISTTEPVEVIGTVDETRQLLEGAPVKVKRKRKVKEEPVYIIPDVEKKATTFKGRLGESQQHSHRTMIPDKGNVKATRA